MSQDVLVAELSRLVSEERNPRTLDIDLLPTAEILRRINDEDKLVAAAVERTIPEIAACVDRITEAFRAGGRLIYMGAGTSGRIGVLDASECPPTFSVPPDMVVGLIAGGYEALLKAVEGAEDSESMGAAALAGIRLAARDVSPRRRVEGLRAGPAGASGGGGGVAGAGPGAGAGADVRAGPLRDPPGADMTFTH